MGNVNLQNDMIRFCGIINDSMGSHVEISGVLRSAEHRHPVFPPAFQRVLGGARLSVRLQSGSWKEEGTAPPWKGRLAAGASRGAGGAAAVSSLPFCVRTAPTSC